MTAMDALVLRSQNQTIVITRSLVPARAAQMRQTSGGELRGALDVHLSGDSVDAQLLSTFWLAAGGPVLSVLRPAELVAAVVAAVEAGRLRAYVFKEPAYISQASHQALRGDAERAVRGPLRSGTPAVGRQLTVAQMGAAERFVEVFHRTVPRVGPELGRQLRAIVENPTDLAFMVGTVVILVQLHAVAAGEVIDGIVLTAIIACAVIEGMGVFQATLAALEAAANLVDFLTTTLAARDEKDLDRAAEKLAAGLSAVGVGILSAALARIAGRFTDSLKKAGGQRKVETVPKEEMAGRGRAAPPPPPDPSKPSPVHRPSSLKQRMLAAQGGSREEMAALRQEFKSLDDTDKIKLLNELVEELDVATKKDCAIVYSGGIIVRDAAGSRFLSARELAEGAAVSKGKMTLEMTPGGRLLDRLKLYPEANDPDPVFKDGAVANQVDAIWRRLSGRFAEGATGDVEAILLNPNPDRVYMSVERKIFLRKGDVSLRERHLDRHFEQYGM